MDIKYKGFKIIMINVLKENIETDVQKWMKINNFNRRL